MAKTGMIERNKRRILLTKRFEAKRKELKAQIADEKLAPDVRFAAVQKLAKLPRNSSKTRIHNRCEVSGRPRAYYRKLKMSRIALRDLASNGQIPGMTKSSW